MQTKTFYQSMTIRQFFEAIYKMQIASMSVVSCGFLAILPQN